MSQHQLSTTSAGRGPRTVLTVAALAATLLVAACGQGRPPTPTPDRVGDVADVVTPTDQPTTVTPRPRPRPTHQPVTVKPTVKPTTAEPTVKPTTAEPTVRPPQPPKDKPVGPATFGRVDGPEGDDTYTVDDAGDQRAFTVAFSDVEAHVEAGPAKQSSSFRFTVPVRAGKDTEVVRLYASTYTLVQGGRKRAHAYDATVWFTVNGRTQVRQWRAGTDDEHVLVMTVQPRDVTRLDVTVKVRARRLKGDVSGAAYVNVTAVDASVQDLSSSGT